MQKQNLLARDTLRNILFIFLFVFLAAGGVSGVYLFFSDSASDNYLQSPEAVKYRDRGHADQSDHHENSYRALVTRDNVTVYIRDLVPVSERPMSGGRHR